MQKAKMRNLLHVSIIYLTFVTKYRKMFSYQNIYRLIAPFFNFLETKTINGFNHSTNNAYKSVNIASNNTALNVK